MKVLENNPGALNRNNITPKSALISDLNNERRIFDKSEMKKMKQVLRYVATGRAA